MLADEGADFLGDDDKFMEGDAPAITRAAALGAAAAAIERHLFEAFLVEIFQERLARGIVDFLAIIMKQMRAARRAARARPRWRGRP